MSSPRVVIIGGGPAGCQAAIYGASEGLNVTLFDAVRVGGQMFESSLLENIGGFPEGITGAELAERLRAQMLKFGTRVRCPERVIEIRPLKDAQFMVIGNAGYSDLADVVVVATGLSYSRLNGVDGLETLQGRGVHYGAPPLSLIEPPRNVCIVGGANSAGQAAVHFADIPGTVVHILIRGTHGIKKTMSAYLVDKILDRANIQVHLETTVRAVKGHDSLEYVRVMTGGEDRTIKADLMAIFIGARPLADCLPSVIARDQYGFIYTGRNVPKGVFPLERAARDFESSAPGIFAIGDGRHGARKRAITAMGEGAAAVVEIHQYLNLHNGR